MPHLRQVLFQINGKGLSSKINRATRAFKGFLKAFKLRYQGVEIEMDIDPESGLADSGDLEIDLPILLETIGEAFLEQKKAFLILIDEMQYLSEIELSALIMAIHKMAQRLLPVVLVGCRLASIGGLDRTIQVVC